MHDQRGRSTVADWNIDGVVGGAQSPETDSGTDGPADVALKVAGGGLREGVIIEMAAG